MNQQAEFSFKQRIQAAITAAFCNPNVSFQVISYQEIAPKFYQVELALDFHIRVDALVFDYGNYCKLWLDSGAIYSFILQPVLERYSREHPWLLGV